MDIKWKRPADGEIPSHQDEYYVIDKNGKHRIMTYYPNKVPNENNWRGKTGTVWDYKKNEDIKCWTDLLSFNG